jgi:uncharacterized membrane protein YccC
VTQERLAVVAPDAHLPLARPSPVIPELERLLSDAGRLARHLSGCAASRDSASDRIHSQAAAASARDAWPEGWLFVRLDLIQQRLQLAPSFKSSASQATSSHVSLWSR